MQPNEFPPKLIPQPDMVSGAGNGKASIPIKIKLHTAQSICNIFTVTYLPFALYLVLSILLNLTLIFFNVSHHIKATNIHSLSVLMCGGIQYSRQ